VVSSLISGSAYLLCLQARAPTGDYIDARGGCTTSTPIGQPQHLRIIDVTHTSVTLEWAPVPAGTSADAYVVRVCMLACLYACVCLRACMHVCECARALVCYEDSLSFNISHYISKHLAVCRFMFQAYQQHCIHARLDIHAPFS
jgi:hypothetical protein